MLLLLPLKQTWMSYSQRSGSTGKMNQSLLSLASRSPSASNPLYRSRTESLSMNFPSLARSLFGTSLRTCKKLALSSSRLMTHTAIRLSPISSATGMLRVKPFPLPHCPWAGQGIKSWFADQITPPPTGSKERFMTSEEKKLDSNSITRLSPLRATSSWFNSN